jgi:catalase
MTINRGQTAYHKNSLAQNDPRPAAEEEGGYVHYQEKVEGSKIRQRSESFKDHFSQAKLFWNSMTEIEKQHMTAAFRFELGKVKSKDVQQQVVDMISAIDRRLAEEVAAGIGAAVNKDTSESGVTNSSPALSQEKTIKVPDTRKVAVLVEDGYNASQLNPFLSALEAAGMTPEVVSHTLSPLKSDDGHELEVDHTFLTSDSVLFDSIYVAGGTKSRDLLLQKKEAIAFLKEGFSHFKAIGAAYEAAEILEAAGIGNGSGVVVAEEAEKAATFSDAFIAAAAEHRHWDREV